MRIKFANAEWKNAALTAVAAGVPCWITLALGWTTGRAAITSIVVTQSGG